MKKITLVILIFFAISAQGQNKVFSGISEYYDTMSSSWQNYSGLNFDYDSNNNLISETGFEWSQDEWKNYSKTTFTYNANNKITERLDQSWNETTNSYENYAKETYTYTSGKPTEIVYYEWSSPNWVLVDKTVISYNGNNLPSAALSYLWDGMQWVNDGRFTTTYNANQKLTEDLGEKWINSNWANDYKSLYTYDSNNKLVTVRFATWDDFNNNWDETDRTDYELDANGNRTKTTYSGSFDSKLEYNYDTSSLMASFANPFNDKSGVDYFAEDFPHINKVLGYNEFAYNTQTSSFEQNGRTTYNYSNYITLATEKREIAKTNLTVFPNPTTSILNFQYSDKITMDKINIIDIAGKIVMKQNQNLNTINVEKLPKGLYIIESFSGKDKFQTKFIKN